MARITVQSFQLNRLRRYQHCLYEIFALLLQILAMLVHFVESVISFSISILTVWFAPLLRQLILFIASVDNVWTYRVFQNMGRWKTILKVVARFVLSATVNTSCWTVYITIYYHRIYIAYRTNGDVKILRYLKSEQCRVNSD